MSLAVGKTIINNLFPFWVIALMLTTLSVAHADVELRADKKQYAKGAPITFILENESNQEVSWSSVSLWPEIIRLGKKEVVVREEPVNQLQMLGILAPHKSKTWKWDQSYFVQDTHGNPIPPTGKQVDAGQYRAQFPTISHSVLQTVFTISDNAVTNVARRTRVALTWGSIKLRVLR